MGWVPIMSAVPVEPGRTVPLSFVGRPTGIPTAEVLVPYFPVDEGEITGLPVTVSSGLLNCVASVVLVPGADTRVEDTGEISVDAETADPGCVTLLVVTSAGFVPVKDTRLVVPGGSTLLIDPAELDISDDGETVDSGAGIFVVCPRFVLSGGGVLLVAVPAVSLTGGATDDEIVDPEGGAFVVCSTRGLVVVCGVDIALAVSVRT